MTSIGMMWPRLHVQWTPGSATMVAIAWPTTQRRHTLLPTSSLAMRLLSLMATQSPLGCSSVSSMLVVSTLPRSRESLRRESSSRDSGRLTTLTGYCLPAEVSSTALLAASSWVPPSSVTNASPWEELWASITTYSRWRHLIIARMKSFTSSRSITERQ